MFRNFGSFKAFAAVLEVAVGFLLGRVWILPCRNGDFGVWGLGSEVHGIMQVF